MLMTLPETGYFTGSLGSQQPREIEEVKSSFNCCIHINAIEFRLKFPCDIEALLEKLIVFPGKLSVILITLY